MSTWGTWLSEDGRRGPRKDISGERFGRLVAVRPCGTTTGRQTVWLCRCDCGMEKEIRVSNLSRNNRSTQSCGCATSERARKYAPTLVKSRVCDGCGGQFRSSRSAHRHCHSCSQIAARMKATGANITARQYLLERAKANGRCSACGKGVPALSADHCHATGRFRGFICDPCNRTEGAFKDDYDRLLKLYAYCVENSSV